ncbi:hypothetical protein FACS189418_3250 [Clostridia bacterium]|nr:hypothetical protein FACS189418_3250 [Clostridia bacterium]
MITVGRLLKNVPLSDRTNSFYHMLYMARAFDVDLFLFAPKDVDWTKQEINGIFFENGDIYRKIVPIPPLVDNQFNLIDKELAPYTLLTRKSLGLSKYTAYKALAEAKTDQFKNMLIPTKLLKKFEDLKNALDEWQGEVVVKPCNGENGNGVVKIQQKNNQYFMTIGAEKKELDLPKLKDYYTKLSKEHLVQPVIDCRTRNGEPFDIRVRCCRNAVNGEFVVNLYPRIGNANGMVSNIHTGGYSMPCELFLKNEFDSEWSEIQERLIRFGKEFPAYYQSFCRNPIFEIGLDVSINTDKEGKRKFWLFEANSFPTGTINLGGNVGTNLIMAYFQYYHSVYKHYIPKNIAS